jgi:hypothetical protein
MPIPMLAQNCTNTNSSTDHDIDNMGIKINPHLISFLDLVDIQSGSSPMERGWEHHTMLGKWVDI